jgi:DNA-binding NarL/FixJ family response regulator
MKLRILLADDHKILRVGLRSVLEAQEGLEVVAEAEHGRQAVQLAQKLRPDLVLMDIVMPELNGIEATQQILDLCPSTQVIILSIFSTGEHIFRALEAGARGYLLKESAGIEVVKAVRAVHARRRYLSQKISDTAIEDYLRQRKSVKVKSPLARLSPREREILQLVVEGKSSAEIADGLPLSIKTVESYRSRLMKKLGIHNLPGLTKFAIQHGIGVARLVLSPVVLYHLVGVQDIAPNLVTPAGTYPLALKFGPFLGSPGQL